MFRLNDEPFGLLDHPPLAVCNLVAQLKDGPWEKRKTALSELVAAGAEQELAKCLGSKDPLITQLASAGLWECWLNEEGPEARVLIDLGIDLLELGKPAPAEKIFRELTFEFPGWPEPANKRASALYQLGRYHSAIALCEWVVDLKPHHFGAWHGLALCAVELKDWHAALQAARKALRLQPRYNEDRKIIELARAKLSLQ